jgi:hypothetical protein
LWTDEDYPLQSIENLSVEVMESIKAVRIHSPHLVMAASLCRSAASASAVAYALSALSADTGFRMHNMHKWSQRKLYHHSKTRPISGSIVFVPDLSVVKFHLVLYGVSAS